MEKLKMLGMGKRGTRGDEEKAEVESTGTRAPGRDPYGSHH